MRAVLGATAFALVITGCAGASGSQPVQRAGSPTPTTRVLGTSATQATVQPAQAPPCGRGGSVADYRRVIWIWMENRSYSQVLGPNGSAPRLASYGRKCGVATAYYALTH